MLQILFSEWIVRVFLVYLFLVGGAAILRRERPALTSPFNLLYPPNVYEHWAGRDAWCAVSPLAWWARYGTRVGYVERRDMRLWKKNNGKNLTYA